MAKKLVLFEINECDFPYIFYGAKRYNFKAITEFFHDKKIYQLLPRIKQKESI